MEITAGGFINEKCKMDQGTNAEPLRTCTFKDRCTEGRAYEGPEKEHKMKNLERMN